MTWVEIGQSNLLAAKELLEAHPRSSASRAYYASHVILTNALLDAGYVLGVGRTTQPHYLQPYLIGIHFNARGAKFVAELRVLIRRLYQRRLDADYRRRATVDRQVARDSLRDVSAVFRLLNVRQVP